ncbi:MAG: hypothetical protein U5K72_12145 [Balneolaceae bacterium]|nr:hypothetical protein [Balneolaceae bacterium]
MIDFLSGLFLDLLLFGGIILLLISPFQKFKEHRKYLIPLGLIFVAIGIAFIDWGAVQAAYWEGYDAANGGQR